MIRALVYLSIGVLAGVLLSSWVAKDAKTPAPLSATAPKDDAVGPMGSSGKLGTAALEVSDDIGARGPGHVALDPLIGHWQTTTWVWDGPDDEPRLVTGTAVRRWALGGRFLQEWSEESSASTFHLYEPRGRRPSMYAGVAYQSLSFLGYDRLRHQYEHLLVHDDSTRMYHSLGRYDPSLKMIVLSGNWLDPYDKSTVEYRYEISIVDDDTHRVSRFLSDAGLPEFKDLEIEYTRTEE